MSHKHCVFCGEEGFLLANASSPCFSPLNPWPADTVGNKPHGYLGNNKERTQKAAELARLTPASEITFIACDDDGNEVL